ncbi:MAG: T9SS type A sorting domain-containing protein [Candidatus Stygibacter frigidus]|nr:T9SS type A sorting domain-containing protein [Candidatus Stygibacter frigidus]
MKKIITLMMMLVLSAALFAGIPHPVFVEFEGTPESFEAYLASDITTFLEDTSVGCGILVEPGVYNLIMVECGNFPIWALDDILYIVMTDNDEEQTQWCEVSLSYDNVQVITAPIWNFGTPEGGEIIQEGVFAPGWNLWSYNVQLESNAVDTVFAPMLPINDGFLTKVKSITQSYDPALDPNFNTLELLVDGYGYWVQVSATDELNLTGAAIDLGTVIALDAGWNLVAYLPQDTDTPVNAFSALIGDTTFENPIYDNLTKIKSITQSFDPALNPNFNTLDSLYAGNGYWVELLTAANFAYVPSGRDIIVSDAVEYIWTPVIYTNSTCAYASLETEGQVGAFVDGECRGVSQINNGCVSLVINGTEEEIATFKLYQNGQVTDLNTEITTAPGEDIFFDFTTDAPVTTQMMKAYPNPFNPVTTIAYQTSEAGNVNIAIYNIKGQKVAELANENQSAGAHSVVWNAAGQASGIYFVKMTASGTEQIQKVILMK